MRRSILFALELRFLTMAGRLFGVEMQHPGVEKDVTVLWCRSASERDVSATAAPGVTNPADAAAAGRACRHKQLLSSPIDAASVRDPSAALVLVPLSHARSSQEVRARPLHAGHGQNSARSKRCCSM